MTILPETTQAPNAGARRSSFWSRLGFATFILVNTLLLIRPQELFPAVKVLHLYELSMILCIGLYWPAFLYRMRWAVLRDSPITICILALLPVIVLSSIWQSRMDMLSTYGVEYAKVVLYYLIFISAVNTPERLRRFALVLAVLITIAGLLPILDRFKLIELETLKILTDNRVDAITGEALALQRLQGVGIFADPNDLAQIMGVGMVLCIYGMEIAKGKARKALWLPSALLMLYAIYLTQSRGGFLGMVAGVAVLFVARFGWRRAVLPGTIALLLVGALFAGRRSAISTTDDSAQSRVQLWSDALEALRHNPLFGLGRAALMSRPDKWRTIAFSMPTPIGGRQAGSFSSSRSPWRSGGCIACRSGVYAFLMRTSPS